ncbi:MAG: cysteine--tRNA ligase [Bacteroidales bacterium]|nr:cysteine--tRNA ligase [Bacteroidales bacterium]
MYLYNTRTRKVEEFKTIDNTNIVRMYSCGPTVYDYAHIGNLSMYVFVDLLRRYMEFSGYKMQHVMNITDVGHLKVDNDENYDLVSNEDKMERAAKKEHLDPWEISKKYTEAFFIDTEKLNIEKPEYVVKATDHIKEMQMIIKKLIEKGFAYVTENENIYFDVSKFKNYGKFSGKNIAELEAGAGGRIDVEELKKDKKNILDFSLWVTDESHIMKWEFPTIITSGHKGYPGWHIECSAMSMKYLTHALDEDELNENKFTTIDIHTGGEDHIFPHHEDEIAQTECATGKQFCNFWMHRKHVLVNGEKMSKSKGNFYTMSDLENGKFGKEKFGPLDFRLWVLMGHYRNQRDFTLDSVKQAKIERQKIEDFYYELKNTDYKNNNNIIKYNYIEEFKNAMDKDLNSPAALAVVDTLINNKASINNGNKKDILDFIENTFNKVFAIINTEKKDYDIPKEIQGLAEERWQAKNRGDYNKADSIREKIDEMGYIIEDAKDKYTIKLK